MTYTPAGSSLAFVVGGNRGDLSDNEYGAVKDVGANTTLVWQTIFKRSGVGSFEFTGGNAGGETSIRNTASEVGAVDASEGWMGAAFYFDSFQSVATLPWLLVWNIAGTSGTTGSAAKPTAKLANDGSLYLGDSGGTSNDTLCHVLSTHTWYYILMRCRTSNGADAKPQELYVYNGLTGALISAPCTKLWDVGAAGATDAFKFGVGTTVNSTGLHFFMEDLVAYKGLLTNPGPQLVYTRRPTATAAANNWTAQAPLGSAAGTVHENIDDITADGDTTVAQVTNATNPNDLLLDLTTIDIPTGDVVHGVQTWVRNRHTGSTPTVHAGVKSGSTTGVSNLGTSASFNDRRTLQATDPATSADWTVAAAEAFQGVIRDADSLNRQIVVTSAAWDVVTAQVVALSAIGKTMEARWGIRTQVADTIEARWADRVVLGDTIQSIWNIETSLYGYGYLGGYGPSLGLTEVGKAVGLQWADRAAIGDVSDLRWRLASLVGDTVDMPWSLRNLVGDLSDLRWADRGRVGDATDVRWSDRALTGDVSDLRWADRGLIGDSTNLRWADRISVGDPADLRWSDRGLISDTMDVRWGIRTPVGDAVGLVWGVRTTTSLTEIVLRWGIQNLVGPMNQLQIIWGVRTPISDSVGLQWGIRVSVDDQINPRWAVRSVAGDQLQVVWNVLMLAGLAADELIIRWAIRNPVGDSLNAPWAIRSLAGDAIDARWNLRAAAAKALAARWNIRALAADAGDLRWGIRTPVADLIEADWAVRRGASQTLVLPWTLKAAVGDPLFLLWRVLGEFTPSDVVIVLTGDLDHTYPDGIIGDLDHGVYVLEGQLD